MIAYLDCFSGISGDMLLGAIADAMGTDEWLRQIVEALGIRGLAVSTSRVQQGFLSAIKVTVETPHEHVHRGPADLKALVDACGVSAKAGAWAKHTIMLLAGAEAKAHGCSIEEVHFHEVGGLDALVDIVGACEGLARLGVQKVYCSALPVGSGQTRCSHGVCPVPAPATMELLHGTPVVLGGPPRELVTPTGAAVLRGVSAEFTQPESMTVTAVGYGSGAYLSSHDELPNVLRLVVGDISRRDTSGPPSGVDVLEANVDDMTPEEVASACEELMAAGAVDVSVFPCTMKKGRPGWSIHVMSPDDGATRRLADCLFRATTTIGVRRLRAERIVCERTIETVHTDFGPVGVKIARRNGRVVNVKPEHDDCRRLSRLHNIPVKLVAAKAMAAASALWD